MSLTEKTDIRDSDEKVVEIEMEFLIHRSSGREKKGTMKLFQVTERNMQQSD